MHDLTLAVEVSALTGEGIDALFNLVGNASVLDDTQATDRTRTDTCCVCWPSNSQLKQRCPWL